MKKIAYKDGVPRWMEDNNVRHEDVVKALQDPKGTKVVQLDSEDGRMRCYGNGLRVVVVPQGNVLRIIHVCHMAELPRRDRQGLPKARGGGGGSSLPATWRELDERLAACGLERRVLDGGHVGFYADGSLILTVPRSASDHRALRNCALQAIRLGYNVRRP